MSNTKKQNKIDVLIVGAGVAGLTAAIAIKRKAPHRRVCVIEKAKRIGAHNVSGACVESGAIDALLELIGSGLLEDSGVDELLEKRVQRDQVLFMAGKSLHFNIKFSLKLAQLFGLKIADMNHDGDYIFSSSKLCQFLAKIATKLGAEIFTGFAASEVIWDKENKKALGVKLVEQGIDKQGYKCWNYVKGESVFSGCVILSEGCDGLLSEKFIEEASLKRKCEQLYSIGAKELLEVSSEQYREFTSTRIVHAMGYPLWRPMRGPAIFGGGAIYPMGENKIAVIMIAALDWKYKDFSIQDALERFKQQKFVKRFIAGAKILEAGAKMIPEAGLRAIPRDENNSIGSANVAILGDSAGLVNMLKIKGMHNSIYSGIAAGDAISEIDGDYSSFATSYTKHLEKIGVLDELSRASNFRQTIKKFGLLFGMPLGAIGLFLPEFDVKKDYESISKSSYPLKLDAYDKSTFVAHVKSSHREDQPSHLIIKDENVCKKECMPKYNAPCVSFCPAGVYEVVSAQLKAANPSNCLHCKTCQRKCPFDNIRWIAPEGGGGPDTQEM